MLERFDMSLIERMRTRRAAAKKRSAHTSEELKAIAKAFGPGSDLALRSIQRDTGYKVTVIRK